MTTDHPNGAPFLTYPRIISWLMSMNARERALKRINRRARARSLLPSIDREYTLYEITIITRAGQAKALGLKSKGHLGVGADADIAIYNMNPREIDPSRDYKTVRKVFGSATYTIKDGQIVVRDGEIIRSVSGRTLWVDTGVPLENVEPDLKRRFREYWTVEYENYIIPETYLLASKPIRIKHD